ncbi:MAG: FtsW/RodA/SpoVE family cell cycle protein [Coriobacteriales bacterium]|jgi:cell division protein FtsW
MARVFKKDKDKGSSSKDAGKGHARERGAKPRRDSVKDRSQGWFAARLQSTPARIMAPRMLYALSVIVLCMLGLVMIYSASSITAYEKFHNASYYFDRQVIFLIFGAIFCVILSVVPYRVLGKPVVFVTLWVIAVGLLCLTAFGGGVSALGAERSIMVGSFAVQPAEFAKIAVVLAMCSLVAMQRENPMPFMRFVVIVLVASLVPLFLIYRQPDLGTAIILAVGLIAMAILAGVPWKAIFIFIGLIAVYVVFACITQPYHLERIISMFDPWLDPNGDGYQSIQSLYAFGNGGLFGTGLGLSRQKYLYLPYAHTDFIFAIIGEELGFVGAACVVLLFGIFIFSGMRIARSAPDMFGCLLAGSLTVMVGFQACVNMACVCGIAPVTGKALPFVSYGGSSIVASLITVGITLSVSMHSSPDVRYERRRDDFLVIEGKKSKKSTSRGGSRAAASSADTGRKNPLAAIFSRASAGKEAPRQGSSRNRGTSSTRSKERSGERGRTADRTTGPRTRTRSAEGTSRYSRSSERSVYSTGRRSTGSRSRGAGSSSRSRSASGSGTRSRQTGSRGTRGTSTYGSRSTRSESSHGYDALGGPHTVRRQGGSGSEHSGGYSSLGTGHSTRGRSGSGSSGSWGSQHGRGRGGSSSRRGL